MALTVRDVDGLEQTLLSAGRVPTRSTDALLKDVANWYDANPELVRIIDRQTFAHLCDCVRSSDDEKARRLAIGALATIRHDSEEHPDRARFVSRFALRRICSLTGKRIGWSGLPIPQVNETEAQELFEIARNDSRYSDEKLLAITSDYMTRFGNSSDMFGRFAQDLEMLMDVITSPVAAPDQRELARAALVHFAEVSDAIPDDVGLVGLLDDALIVRRAVEQIRPGRSVLSAYLDSAVSEWPFLKDLALEAECVPYGLSEFVIINLCLLLRGTGEQAGSRTGRAVITADFGPLPFLLGFIRALAEVRGFVSSDRTPHFEQGERLADRNTGAEVEFKDYGRLEGTTYQTCDREEAGYFRVRQPGKVDAWRIKPVQDLASLRRSTRDSGRLRRGALALDGDATPVGPLERTFGAVFPIVIPAHRGQVIVVAPIKASEALARSLALHGKALADVVPMGQARVDEDEIVSTRWTRDGPGGADLLTVVRTSAEAVELAERTDRPVLGVVGAVRLGSTDASNLRRLSSDSIPVLALVEDADQESQETLQKGNFSFWSWDEEWLRHLRWPPQTGEEAGHPVANHEHRIRTHSSAKVAVSELDLPSLGKAKQALDRLNGFLRDRDDEILEAAVGDGFRSLVLLCRHCVGAVDGPTPILDRFKVHLRSGAQWWPDEVIAEARAVETALEAALATLRSANPKRDFVAGWAGQHPNGSVVARPAERALAESDPVLSELTWTAAPSRVRIPGSLLVPGWLGRSTMERLLHPPAATNIELALYGPELAWYRLFTARHARARERITALVRERSAIPQGAKEASPQPRVELPRVEEPLVDEIVGRIRRARVLRQLGSADAGETVGACLVYFTGGHWAAFSPGYRVNSVSHLAHGGTADSGEEGLREVSAGELRPGDWILMVRGSDRDALRHAADRELPSDARQNAAEWQAALRRFIEDGHTQTELRQRLAQEGCLRASATIRSWLLDDRIIGPKDALEGTIERIQKATADARLEARLKSCKEAIHLIRSTHFTVAHRLAERVLDRAREWLDIDATPDELVEVEERLVLLVVDSVDPELTPVPRSALNRLREESS